MTANDLNQIARAEIKAWHRNDRKARWRMPSGLVEAILFAFVHRVTTSETVEQTFFEPKLDYEI